MNKEELIEVLEECLNIAAFELSEPAGHEVRALVEICDVIETAIGRLEKSSDEGQ